MGTVLAFTLAAEVLAGTTRVVCVECAHVQQSSHLGVVACGDHVFHEFDVHAPEAAILAAIVEHTGQVHHCLAALQCDGQTCPVERVGLDHFRDGAQFGVPVCMAGNYAALVSPVAQSLGDMPTDETRATDKCDTLDVHFDDWCSC